MKLTKPILQAIEDKRPLQWGYTEPDLSKRTSIGGYTLTGISNIRYENGYRQEKVLWKNPEIEKAMTMTDCIRSAGIDIEYPKAIENDWERRRTFLQAKKEVKDMVSAKELSPTEAKEKLLKLEQRNRERNRAFLERQKAAGKKRIVALIDDELYQQIKDDSRTVSDIINDALSSYFSSDIKKDSKKNVSTNTETKKKKPAESPGILTFQDSMKAMQELRKDGLSYQKIADELNDKGYPKQDDKAGKWSKQEVSRYIKQTDKPADLLEIIRSNAGKSRTVPVWKVRALYQGDFDKDLVAILPSGEIELVGGDPSGLTDKQYEDCITLDGKRYINIQYHG